MSVVKSVVTHEVLYAETDMMGIVHHRNYLVWMEKGRIKLMSMAGIDIKAYEDQGYYLPVVEVFSRYKSPAVYGNTVRIETWLKNRHRSLLTFKSVLSVDNRIINIGEVKCAVVDHQRKIAEFLPEALEESLRVLIKEEA